MAVTTASRVPSFVPPLNPLLKRLLRWGVPMGPNGLLTVRGRKSGLQRTTPVAVVEAAGRRGVIGTLGGVNRVRHLRAAREGTLEAGGPRFSVQAAALVPADAGPLLQDLV